MKNDPLKDYHIKIPKVDRHSERSFQARKAEDKKKIGLIPESAMDRLKQQLIQLVYPLKPLKVYLLKSLYLMQLSLASTDAKKEKIRGRITELEHKLLVFRLRKNADQLTAMAKKAIAKGVGVGAKESLQAYALIESAVEEEHQFDERVKNPLLELMAIASFHTELEPLLKKKNRPFFEEMTAKATEMVRQLRKEMEVSREIEKRFSQIEAKLEEALDLAKDGVPTGHIRDINHLLKKIRKSRQRPHRIDVLTEAYAFLVRRNSLGLELMIDNIFIETFREHLVQMSDREISSTERRQLMASNMKRIHTALYPEDETHFE